MAESKLTSKYQVTIPKEIREMYQIKEGDRLIFLPLGDKIIMEKKREVRLSRELPLKIKVPKIKDVHEWREMAKKEAAKRA
jgi:AbrB family looped-hinge helix DNA binding protein